MSLNNNLDDLNDKINNIYNYINYNDIKEVDGDIEELYEQNDINNNDKQINQEQLDELTDDNLWDILHDFANHTDEQILDVNNDKKCKECGSINMIFSESRSVNICSDCGIIGNEVLDENPEWNNYEDNKKDLQRGGTLTNVFLPKTSLGTNICSNKFLQINKLHCWNQMPYKERSLSHVLRDIDNKCKKYKITKAVIDNAKIIYKIIRDSLHNKGKNKGKNIIIRGKNRRQIIAACVYLGSNLQGCARSDKEIADIFELEKPEVTKGSRKIHEYLHNNILLYDIKPQHGTDFINRYGNKINLDKNVLELANIISNNTAKLDIATNHQPTSIAAASILIAINNINDNNKDLILSRTEEENLNDKIIYYDETKIKKNIMKEFKISEVTLNKTRDSILNYIDIVRSNDKTEIVYNQMNDKFLNSNINNDDILTDSNDNSYLNNIFINNKIDNSEKLNMEEYKEKYNNDFKIEYDDDFDINNIISNDVIKKKRGRKPKLHRLLNSLTVSESITNTESSDILTITSDKQEIKKKRGRPRKVIINDSNI